MAKRKKNKSTNEKPAAPAVKPEQLKKERNIVLICLLAFLGILLVSAVVYAALLVEKDNAVNNAEETALSSAEEQETQQIEETTEPEQTSEPEETASDFDTSQTYFADITVENYGTITVQLDPSAAPISVQNFVELAQEGFYNGLTFHRIMDGFMMQGGDPTGTGSGGSDQEIKGEFSANGWDNPLSHTRGAISMARATDFNSASSQFFIVQSDSTFLDGQYACFGYVTEGMEYVDAICAGAEPTDDNGTIPAENQPVISSVVIRTE